MGRGFLLLKKEGVISFFSVPHSLPSNAESPDSSLLWFYHVENIMNWESEFLYWAWRVLPPILQFASSIHGSHSKGVCSQFERSREYGIGSYQYYSWNNYNNQYRSVGLFPLFFEIIIHFVLKNLYKISVIFSLWCPEIGRKRGASWKQWWAKNISKRKKCTRWLCIMFGKCWIKHLFHHMNMTL